jgi:hypothetical protein
VGSFYTSHTLKGPSQPEILEWLKDRPAYVSRTDQSVTMVLDEACETQDGQLLSELAQELSATFKCPVLAVLNHDDDVLYMELYVAGEKTDEYNSSPGFFDESVDDDAPTGGDAEGLCKAFASGDPEAVEQVLRGSDYVIATARHQELVKALGLPSYLFGIGYNYASNADFPPTTPAGCYEHSAA